MNRTIHAIGAALLLSATALHAGCSSSAGVLAGGGELPADAPAMVNNADPLARPVQVAWTAARAQRCGFNFDPAKFKANYIAYESRQGAAGDQMVKLQQTYDTTLQAVAIKVSADAGYCTDKKSAEIKGDLTRHLAGDYAPNLPKPILATCGTLFDPCNSGITNQPFESKSFWQDRDQKNVSNSSR